VPGNSNHYREYFANWTGGTFAIIGMTINGFGGTSVSNNTISTILGQGAITGLNM
jgi:hypothetical protein